MAERLDRTPGVAALELNLSCPNAGLEAVWAHEPALTARAVRAVRERTELPVWAKLAPDVPDIRPIAHAARTMGADALTVCNTMPSESFDVGTGAPRLGNTTGGLSGAGLRPVAIALVRRAADGVDIPVVGAGGVASGRDALEHLMAGASAVQVGTAMLADPRAALRVLRELREAGKLLDTGKIAGERQNEDNRHGPLARNTRG